MSRWMLGLGLISTLAMLPSVARATPVEDARQCLSAATTDTDKAAIVRWAFSAMSEHPLLKEMIAVPEAKRRQYRADFAAVIERLVFDKCRPQVVALAKADDAALGDVFGQITEDAFGRIEQAIPLDKEAALVIGSMDTKRWRELEKETGRPLLETP